MDDDSDIMEEERDSEWELLLHGMLDEDEVRNIWLLRMKAIVSEFIEFVQSFNQPTKTLNGPRVFKGFDQHIRGKCSLSIWRNPDTCTLIILSKKFGKSIAKVILGYEMTKRKQRDKGSTGYYLLWQNETYEKIFNPWKGMNLQQLVFDIKDFDVNRLSPEQRRVYNINNNFMAQCTRRATGFLFFHHLRLTDHTILSKHLFMRGGKLQFALESVIVTDGAHVCTITEVHDFPKDQLDLVIDVLSPPLLLSHAQTFEWGD